MLYGDLIARLVNLWCALLLQVRLLKGHLPLKGAKFNSDGVILEIHRI